MDCTQDGSIQGKRAEGRGKRPKNQGQREEAGEQARREVRLSPSLFPLPSSLCPLSSASGGSGSLSTSVRATGEHWWTSHQYQPPPSARRARARQRRCRRGKGQEDEEGPQEIVELCFAETVRRLPGLTPDSFPPKPASWEPIPPIKIAGYASYEFRADFVVRNNGILTKTYTPSMIRRDFQDFDAISHCAEDWYVQRMES
jgi:hypothetical protein